MIDIKKICMPTDFSETSLVATRYALEFARRFGAELHVLHVIEDPVVYLPMFDSIPIPPPEDFEKFAIERLENWILPEDREGITVINRWVHGTPFVEIVRDAQEHDVDLIILGTHGRGFAKHLLLGNVAEKVTRKASCPVLTVRPEGHQFVHPIDGGE